jgi:carbamoyl-phosphate synthase large subunit
MLSPEMKSTGEVMGIDREPGIAFLKSQIAAGSPLPKKGNIFISVSDREKESAVPLVRELIEIGFQVFATRGTATLLRDRGIKAQAVFRIPEGRPNALDLIRDGEVSWVINLPSAGRAPLADEKQMRIEAVVRGIPITTTIRGLRAAVEGLHSQSRLDTLDVYSLQELHSHIRLHMEGRAKSAKSKKAPARPVQGHSEGSEPK